MNRNRKMLLYIGVLLIFFLVSRLGGGRQQNEPVTTQPQMTSEVLTTESTTKEVLTTESTTKGESTTGEEQKTEPASETETPAQEETSEEADVREDGEYTSAEEVAAYLHRFGHLPSNYITKNQAKKLGWVSSEGNLGKVAPGKSIGGDYFGNFEGQLSEKKGRSYYECDIDTNGGFRGAKRIIYSNDGLIYYTEDHYETFTLLYGEE